MRRLLVGGVVGLAVARPLVFGEDPGMLFGPTDAGNLWFTLLWFILVGGYAGWCAVAGRSFGRPNLIETALFVAVVGVFISAEVAATNKHPARIIAWEWTAYLLAFGLARRLTTGPAERAGIYTALLASAVSLSAFGVYQAAVEFPANRAQFQGEEGRAKLRDELARQGLYYELDDPRFHQVERRLDDRHVFGSYAHPNCFAGFLALFVPGLIVAAGVSATRRLPAWQIALTIACAALGCVAVWLTHSRGAILGIALAGGLIGCYAARRWMRSHLAWALLGLLALGGAGYGAWSAGLLTTRLGKDTGGLRVRKEYWDATVKMIQEKPWWGFGPGNFGSAYPRFMTPTAEEKIKDPHNFALEMWVSAGLLAFVALVAALALLFIHMRRQQPDDGDDGPVLDALQAPLSLTPPIAAPGAISPWTFYLGGMFGLLLGFVLRAWDLSPSTIRTETENALGRSVAWFGSFALLSLVPWSPRTLKAAFAVGAVALLLNLSVSGGLMFPAVATLFWIVGGLAVADVAARPVVATGPLRLVPLLGAFLISLAFFLNVFHPVWTAVGYARRASREGDVYLDMERNSPNKRANTTKADHIRRLVINPLERAAAADPTDSWSYTQLAHWYTDVWSLLPGDGDAAKRARAVVERAQKLNPEGGDPVQERFRMSMRFAEYSEGAAEMREKQRAAANPRNRRQFDDEINFHKLNARTEYSVAANVLNLHLRNDPHEPRLRVQLAEAYFKAGEPVKAREQARKARELNEALTTRAAERPARSLTDRHLKLLDQWLGPATPP